MAAELNQGERLIVEAMNQARANGKWLIAVWSLNDKSQLQKDIVTSEFPLNAFQNCKEDLLDFIAQQAPELETRPLPAADLGLFGVELDNPPLAPEEPMEETATLMQKAIEFPGEEDKETENAPD